MLISEEYRKLNSDLHKADPSWGDGKAWVHTMAGKIADHIKAETILDYGAGKEALKAALGSKVISYDPAIEAISQAPEPADLLVSCAVLEHVEPDCLGAVLLDMQRCTLKNALIVVTTIPSSKILGDGRNAHLIIETPRWWLNILMAYWDINAMQLSKIGFWFIGTRKKLH